MMDPNTSNLFQDQNIKSIYEISREITQKNNEGFSEEVLMANIEANNAQIEYLKDLSNGLEEKYIQMYGQQMFIETLMEDIVKFPSQEEVEQSEKDAQSIQEKSKQLKQSLLKQQQNLKNIVAEFVRAEQENEKAAAKKDQLSQQVQELRQQLESLQTNSPQETPENDGKRQIKELQEQLANVKRQAQEHRENLKISEDRYNKQQKIYDKKMEAVKKIEGEHRQLTAQAKEILSNNGGGNNDKAALDAQKKWYEMTLEWMKQISPVENVVVDAGSSKITLIINNTGFVDNSSSASSGHKTRVHLFVHPQTLKLADIKVDGDEINNIETGELKRLVNDAIQKQDIWVLLNKLCIS
ncbi:hypothetical protein H4219_004793 [Mycoemilia scoparia]|uniref:Uncharacterized protein n=1 Tax=Mycoemilia scoparia TaxID=417184 RepID=A0A9W8A009_9FUNG|nr:hypothetical protein H4219_004793 [Mycoemilia scoparia]